MKPIRVVLLALSLVIVAGAVAAASGSHPATPASDEVNPTLTPEAADPSSGAGLTPDFSACGGSTGLENAMCRHEALIALHPDVPGLSTSFSQLESNLAAHLAARAASAAAAAAPGNSAFGHAHAPGAVQGS